MLQRVIAEDEGEGERVGGTRDSSAGSGGTGGWGGGGRKLKAMSREDKVKKGKGRIDFCL